MEFFGFSMHTAYKQKIWDMNGAIWKTAGDQGVKNAGDQFERKHIQ